MSKSLLKFSEENDFPGNCRELSFENSNTLSPGERLARLSGSSAVESLKAVITLTELCFCPGDHFILKRGHYLCYKNLVTP